MPKKENPSTSLHSAKGKKELLTPPEQAEASKVDVHVDTGHKGLQGLIEKNIKWSQVIYEQNRRIKHRLTMMVVANYLRLFIILAPIILAIIFLPPFVKKVMDQYGQLLGAGASPQINEILSQIPADQIQELLKLLGQQQK